MGVLRSRIFQDTFETESLRSVSSKHVVKTRCNFIIQHNSRFKVLWDWLILVMVIFTAIQIPFYAAFEQRDIMLDLVQERKHHWMLFLSLIVDFMFFLDIFINFRTTYVQSTSDELVTDPRKLAIHYAKTWFIIDLLAAIPFDWIIIALGGSSGNTPTLIGLLKSARLLRLFRIARKLDRYSEYGVAVLFLLMALFTLISHWLACLWNWIAIMEENNSNSWVRRMDAIKYGPVKGNSTKIRMKSGERYIASLYFIVSSLTSVGFGNIAANTGAEQVFSVIIMLIGALMYASIFGNMVAIVQRLYSKASSFHNHMNTIREFLRFYKIPEELRISIVNYVRREWTVSRGVDIESVLRRFPDCIQADLTYELYQVVFQNVDAFKHATVSCLRALALKFKTMTLHVNNYPLRHGEEINHLYILGKGSLEILIDGDLVELLAKYSVFGYDFVKQPKFPKSKANVRASCLAEIYYIHKDDMKDILQSYPKFASKFRELIQLNYDLNDENEEGYFNATPKKEKVHATTIAKMALAMPIMARWTKGKKRNLQRKSSRSSQKSDVTQFKHSSTNCFKRPISMSLDDLGLREKQDKITLSPILKNGEKSSFNSNYFKETVQPVVEKKATSVNLENYENLNKRINTLQDEVHDLRKTLDSQIGLIMSLLQDIKWQTQMHFTGNEYKNEDGVNPSRYKDYLSISIEGDSDGEAGIDEVI